MLAPAPVYTATAPAWLTPEVAEVLAGLAAADGRLEIAGAFSPADRKVLRKRRPVPVSEWSERHRVVALSAIPGPWRNAVTPYLSGVMDASFFESVQTVVICAAPQTGKSEAVNNCVGYAIDRDPGPVLYVYPDRLTARDNCRDRIQAMIQHSPRLRGYVRSVVEDMTLTTINLEHMPVYFSWARSPSRLANKPIRHLVFDETDKYEYSADSREADPVSLGELRTRTYKDSRKIWKISSPTIEAGYIWQAFTTEAQFRYDYFVRCPFCGHPQRMLFEQIKFPADCRDPEVMETRRLARYECVACRAPWDDEDRNRAVRAGEWRERESGLELFAHLRRERPVKIAVHIPSWLSWFVSLSEVAAAFLKGLKSKAKLKDFYNAHRAEPWRDYGVERREDAVLALRDDRPRGRVPAGGIVAGLTAGVDSQAGGFIYEIRAWGYGEIEDSWQVREGFVTSLEALDEILWTHVYKDADGLVYPIALVVMDAMGHRTTEVYDFCRVRRGLILPFKGEGRMAAAIAYSKIDHYPGAKSQPIPGGPLQLLRANVNYFKSALSKKLDIAPADPGAWRLHAETDAEWARQMTAEYLDPKTQQWTAIEGRPNHAWDVSVYNLVAAYACGLRFWPKPAAEEDAAPARPRIVKPSRW
jgi:phage terminase large subunit GpA-like protein